jgi:hypothetical protein
MFRTQLASFRLARVTRPRYRLLGANSICSPPWARFATLGIHQIVTLIDSDVPNIDAGERFGFRGDELVLLLLGEDGSG